MKNLLSVLLLCTLLLSSISFAACDEGDEPHTHTFATEWSSDAENHWHAATCKHTSEISDKSAHSFGTDDTCDVCAYVNSDIMTDAKWRALFAKEQFVNCTMLLNINQTETILGQRNEQQSTTTIKIEGVIDGDKEIKYDYSTVFGPNTATRSVNFKEQNGVLYVNENPATEAEISYLKSLAYGLFDFSEYYSEFTRDGDTYTASASAISFEYFSQQTPWTTKDVASVVITVANGKLASVKYQINYVADYGSYTGTGIYKVEYTFSNYGTTVVE